MFYNEQAKKTTDYQLYSTGVHLLPNFILIILNVKTKIFLTDFQHEMAVLV